MSERPDHAADVVAAIRRERQFMTAMGFLEPCAVDDYLELLRRMLQELRADSDYAKRRQILIIATTAVACLEQYGVADIERL